MKILCITQQVTLWINLISLVNFTQENPRLPVLPKKLPLWIKAYEDGRENYSELENDLAMEKKLRSAFFQKEGG